MEGVENSPGTSPNSHPGSHLFSRREFLSFIPPGLAALAFLRGSPPLTPVTTGQRTAELVQTSDPFSNVKKVDEARMMVELEAELQEELNAWKDPTNRFRLEMGVNPPWDPDAPKQLETETLLFTTEYGEKATEMVQYPGYPRVVIDGETWRGAGAMGSDFEKWNLVFTIPGESMADPPYLGAIRTTNGNSELTPVALLAPTFSLFTQNPATIFSADVSSESPRAVTTQVIFDGSSLWSETTVVEKEDDRLILAHSFRTEATFGSPVIANIIEPSGQKTRMVIIAEDKYGPEYFNQKFARLYTFDLETNQAVLAIDLPERYWFNGNDHLAVYEGDKSSYIAVPLRTEGSEPRVNPNDPPPETLIAIYATHEGVEPTIITLEGEPSEIGWAEINGVARLVVTSKYKHKDGTVRGRLQVYDTNGQETILPIEVLGPDGEEWYRFTNIAIVTNGNRPLLLATGATDYMVDNLLLGVDLSSGETLFSLANKIPYCHYGVIAVRAPTIEGPERLFVSIVGYDGGQPGINAVFINPAAETVEFIPLEGMPVGRLRSEGAHSFSRPALVVSGEKGEEVALLAPVTCLGDEETFLELNSFDLSDQLDLPDSEVKGWCQIHGGPGLPGREMGDGMSSPPKKFRVLFPHVIFSAPR